jgi:putative nucleotidyltransferase with HDIG domain
MEGFIEGSFVAVPVITSQAAIGVITLSGGSAGRRLGPEYVHVLRIACSMIGNEIENRQLYARLEEGYFETVRAVAAALEAKDPATRGHSERVMGYAEGISRELGLSEERVRAIRFAAILHDIGKVGVSDAVIGKRGRLNPEEFIEIQGHTEIGSGILSSSGLFETLKEYVKYHHEKLDGTGYYGKKKGEYPWESTIISLADMFDALTSDRPYRAASSFADVLRSLTAAIDVAFERSVFEALVAHLKREGRLAPDFDPFQKIDGR